MTIADALNHFHFIRPWWLLGIIPALFVTLWLWRLQYQAKNWQQLIDPSLLPFLLDGKTTRAHHGYIIGLIAAWLIAVIALAGPSWEKRPVAMEKNQQAMVIMLDLSPSMLSEDLKPSRLVRARLKIADILRQRGDGFTALLVFAGDAHVVTPLTDDIKTINNLLPDLSPNIMPLPGSNTEAAVTRAIALLQDAGIAKGELLLVTDGVESEAQNTIADQLKTQTNFRLSILGVGTANPTPIPSSKGGFVRDRRGNIVTTQLNISELQSLAQKTGGLYRTITETGADVNYLVRHSTPVASDTQQVDREFDSWYDRGHWLVLLLLPVILYCFRRGVLLTLFVLPILGFMPQPSQAFTWADLWKNKDQQGYDALNQQKATEAAALFDNNDWKGSALYRAGNYAEAAREFSKNTTAQGHYNRGNALAKAGQLDEAIKAYDEALQQDADMEDAKKNRDLLEQLKKQQQNQQQNQDNNDQKNNDEQKDDSQKNESGQNSSQQNQQDQNQDQQNQQQGQQQSSASNQQSNEQQTDQQQTDQQNSDQQDSQQPGEKQSSASEEPQAGSESENQSSASDQTGAATSEGSNSSARNSDQAQAQASSANGEKAEDQQQMAQPTPDDGLTDEERQAMEQWLRRVPDEPGLLLKNKFRDQYQKRRMQMYNGEWQAPENGANERL